MRSIVLADQTDFGGWRSAARRLALDDVAPEDVNWSVGSTDTLFADAGDDAPPDGDAPAFTVPRAFIQQSAAAILHRDVDRFAFLYRVLWRPRREPGLLEIAVDPDIVRLEAMTKAIRRDLHKMKAYVRFREVVVPEITSNRVRPAQFERAVRNGDPIDGMAPWFVAWFEPSHYIVEAVSPFFSRRFTSMRWAILTPDRSASWDGTTLSFGPGAQRSDAPEGDVLEDLWRSYYANIFNPARLKLASMQGHMPKKYWKNLPEAELIAPLAAAARQRMDTMIEADALPAPARTERVMQAAGHRPADRQTTAALPDTTALPETTALPDLRALDLPALATAARDCRACPLWEPATQTVFGEGTAEARIVVVGEQPGDQEDLAGKPFVGPAGQLFNRALAAAGIDRSTMYVTNAVKHFKFIMRGKRRLHQTPKTLEIRACHPWLEAEIGRLQPALVIAMGASAAQSVFGRATPVEKSRRQFFEHAIGGHRTRVVVTVHPSYLLRLPDEDARAAAYDAFVEDLRIAHDSI